MDLAHASPVRITGGNTARAAQRYLDELDAESLTHQIDQALRIAGTDESSSDAVAAGRRLAGEDGW